MLFLHNLHFDPYKLLIQSETLNRNTDDKLHANNFTFGTFIVILWSCYITKKLIARFATVHNALKNQSMFLPDTDRQ